MNTEQEEVTQENDKLDEPRFIHKWLVDRNTKEKSLRAFCGHLRRKKYISDVLPDLPKCEKCREIHETYGGPPPWMGMGI